MDNCGAALNLGDDWIAKCQLPPEHPLPHSLVEYKFTVTWDKDEREACERCKRLSYDNELAHCQYCDQKLCEAACMSGETSFCKECVAIAPEDVLFKRKLEQFASPGPFRGRPDVKIVPIDDPPVPICKTCSRKLNGDNMAWILQSGQDPKTAPHCAECGKY